MQIEAWDDVSVSIDTISTPVTKICGDFFIPDAFSPNNDRKNDTLLAKMTNPSCLTTFNFFIYNRWGQKVFESHDIKKGWDDSISGSGGPAFLTLKKSTHFSSPWLAMPPSG